ncbi:MAG: CopG family transcriptional regulator [Thermoanaerobaculia bacterium]|nr:CopG family transcriptional regulator [Thermoanaerobaculia bacterium]
MVRTQVSLDPRMYEEARQEAERQGISFAELCRRALGSVLLSRLQDQPWMRFAGALESGDPTASQSIDTVVYGRKRP